MSVPVPDYALENVCTTIFNNTLYTYSNAAFQSLELTAGATWQTLSPGVHVQGSVCVKTTPVDNVEASALWIVGGRAENETDYMGLQRYEFMTKQWETIRTVDPVARDRMWHGAAYLNKSDSILMYAGTQDGTRQASSQTFTIQTSAPYDVTAYEAAAPPAIAPVVIPWTQSKALYIGGSETNTKVMLFSPSKSWIDSNATLASPFYNCSRIQAISQNGNDASKNIYTFDMSVKPNSVNRTVIIDGDGNPVQNAVPVRAANAHSAEKEPDDDDLERRGDLTVANWPEYNGTLAPGSVRRNFAVARDQSGMTVITGGNEEDVLCIFKARDNCWMNSTQIFSAQSVTASELAPGALPSSPATTDPAAASSSPATSVSKSGTPFPVKILGAVLGSVLGVALLMIGFLFYLRWKKKQRAFSDLGHQRRASGLSDEKMDFVDRGLPHMSSTRQYRHQPKHSAGSFSSVAILLGRTKGHKRGTENGHGSQGSETSSQFNKDYKAAIGKPTPIQDTDQSFRAFTMPTGDEKQPIVQERVSPRPRPGTKVSRLASTRRSSGWNRYWSGGSALNILGFGKRTTIADDERSDRSSGSRYSEAPRVPSQVMQTSPMVPPLKFGDRPLMQRVNSGSPTVHNNGEFNFMRASTAQIQRPGSVSTLSSFDGKRDDAFSSGIPESVYDEFSTTRQSSNVFADPNYPMRDTQIPRPPQPSHPHQQPSRGQPSTDMSWLNLGDQRRL